MTDPTTYQRVAIAKALELYVKTGMLVNRAYTPTNMLKTASRLTGQKFRRGEYLKAAEALRTPVLQKL